MPTLICRRPVEICVTDIAKIEYTVVCVNQRISLQINEAELLNSLGVFDSRKRFQVAMDFLANERRRHDQHTDLVLRDLQVTTLNGQRWHCLDLEVIPYGLTP